MTLPTEGGMGGGATKAVGGVACAALVGLGFLLERPGGAAEASAPPPGVVRLVQRGGSFGATAVTAAVGDVLRFVNGEGQVRHHAYTDEPGFAFDTGDQEPGAVVDVPLGRAGAFAVLCGIHPKMRVDVVVR